MRTAVFITSTKLETPPADIPIVDIENLQAVDQNAVSFFLVDFSDWQTGYGQLRTIRSSVIPEIYLKPVIFFNGPESAPKEIILSADGLIDMTDLPLSDQLEKWAARFEGINAKIHQFSRLSTGGDTNIGFKILRYIASRNMEIHPLPSVRTISGYVFPPLQPLLPKSDTGLLETLEYLETQKLLSASFINNAYACTHCGCAFLNFFETCPDCGSNDLKLDELIHHFKCAYVGELSDFRRDDKLICPKCDKSLKHIGVDYDKTSIVYHCNQCGNIFQEPGVMTTCYNCQRETEPENQVQRTIQSYSITAIGENAGLYGMDSLFQNILEKKLHALPFKAFQDFFRVERTRIQRYGVSTSSLALLQFSDIEELYVRLGKRTHEVFNEISEAFKEGLRSSDVFSIRNESLFLVILTETTRQKGELALLRLKERIDSLLRTNLDLKIEIHFSIEQIASGLELETCMEKFLNDHAA